MYKHVHYQTCISNETITESGTRPKNLDLNTRTLDLFNYASVFLRFHISMVSGVDILAKNDPVM